MIEPRHANGGTESGHTEITAAAELLARVSDRTVLRTADGVTVGFFVPVEKVALTSNAPIDALTSETWDEISRCGGDFSQVETITPDDWDAYLSSRLGVEIAC